LSAVERAIEEVPCQHRYQAPTEVAVEGGGVEEACLSHFNRAQARHEVVEPDKLAPPSRQVEAGQIGKQEALDVEDVVFGYLEGVVEVKGVGVDEPCNQVFQSEVGVGPELGGLGAGENLEVPG